MRAQRTLYAGLATAAVALTIAASTSSSPAAIPRERTLTSDAWAGQIALSSAGLTRVTAHWKVPAVSCAAHENGTSYAWVGLGGWTEQALEQIGTAQ